jgi:hypothetical protein
VTVAGETHHITIESADAVYGFMARNGYQVQRADDFAPRISVGTDPSYREGIWDAWAQSGFPEGIDQPTVRNLNKILSSDGNIFGGRGESITLDAAWNSSDASKSATAPMIVDFPGGTNYVCVAVDGTGVASRIRRYNLGSPGWSAATTTFASDVVWLHQHGGYMFAACGSGDRIQRSADLDTWTEPDVTPGTQTANCLTTWVSGTTTYLVLGFDGYIKLSSDSGVTWGSAITVGDANINITGLGVAFGLLVIGKEDGLYHYDGTTVVEEMTFRNKRYAGNCKALVYHEGFLYTHILGQVVKLSFSAGGISNMVDVTPVKYGDESEELYGHGVPVWIWSGPFNLYVAFDDGAALYPEVLMHNGMGWHQAYKGASGDSMLAGGYSRLGSTTFINDGATRLRKHATLRDLPYPDYPATGVFVTSDFDGDLPFVYKAFREIAIEAENITSGVGSITVAYSLDKGANYVALGVITESGKTYLQFPGGTAVASPHLRLRFTIARNSASSTPRMRRWALWVLMRPTPIYVFHVDLKLAEGQIGMDDVAETAGVDERLSFLLGAEASKTPVTFGDWKGREYQVYITKTARDHLEPKSDSALPEEIWMGVDMIIVLQGGKWDEVYWDAFNWS